MSLLNEMFDDNNDDELNEARPYSRTQSAVDAAKGKVKGMFGSGQVEQGAQEVGAEANKLWNEFKHYIGRKYGKAQSTVPYADVVQFFKGKQLDPKFLGNNQRRSFTPKDVGNALLQAAREYMNDYRDQDEEQPQSQGNPPAQGQPQGQPQEQPQPSPQGGSGNPMASQLQGLSQQERDNLLRMLS